METVVKVKEVIGEALLMIKTVVLVVVIIVLFVVA